MLNYLGHTTCLVKHTWYDDISTLEKSRYIYSHDYIICATKSLRVKLTTKLTASSSGCVRRQVNSMENIVNPNIEKINTLKLCKIIRLCDGFSV